MVVVTRSSQIDGRQKIFLKKLLQLDGRRNQVVTTRWSSQLSRCKNEKNKVFYQFFSSRVVVVTRWSLQLEGRPKKLKKKGCHN